MTDGESLKSAYMTLNEYMTNCMAYARNAAARLEEWLPSSPIDVNERVYVELGEREFSHWSGANTLPLADFIAELQGFAAKAPKRSEVVIEISASSDYDESSANARYEVGYFRDPTEEEKAERREANRKIAEREERRAIEAAERERAEFERLRAKYGKPTPD